MIGNIFKEISEAAKTTSLSELSKDIPLASTEELNMPIDKYSLYARMRQMKDYPKRNLRN